jgi:hypothetical protein
MKIVQACLQFQFVDVMGCDAQFMAGFFVVAIKCCSDRIGSSTEDVEFLIFMSNIMAV